MLDVSEAPILAILLMLSNLQNIFISLILNNFTQLKTNKIKSKPIKMCQDAPQLSPTIFNLTKILNRYLSDLEVAFHCYQIVQNLNNNCNDNFL